MQVYTVLVCDYVEIEALNEIIVSFNELLIKRWILLSCFKINLFSARLWRERPALLDRHKRAHGLRLGQPCPVPPGRRDVIRGTNSALRKAGRHFESRFGAAQLPHQRRQESLVRHWPGHVDRTHRFHPQTRSWVWKVCSQELEVSG